LVYPRESGREFVGLVAMTVINHSAVFLSKVRVDFREEHNYTICWSIDNATFLVDGLKVATTDKVPKDVGLGFFAIADNSCHHYRDTSVPKPADAVPFWDNSWEMSLGIDHNFSLILDQYQIRSANFTNNFTSAIENARGRIIEAESAGVNASYLWEIHGKAAEEFENTGYLKASSYKEMLSIGLILPDLVLRFATANDKLSDFRKMDRERDLKRMGAHYRMAVISLTEGDPQESRRHLDLISSIYESTEK